GQCPGRPSSRNGGNQGEIARRGVHSGRPPPPETSRGPRGLWGGIVTTWERLYRLRRTIPLERGHRGTSAGSDCPTDKFENAPAGPRAVIATRARNGGN